MKTKTIISFIALTMILNYVQSQEKTTYYHVKENTVKTKSFSDVTQSISFTPGTKEISLTYIVGALIPHILKHAPKLFYNPKKYMKEYGTDGSLLTESDFRKFGSIKTITYKQESKGEVLTMLGFKLIDSSMPMGYRGIFLTDAKFNYTPVKLKTRHFKTNVVIELIFNYYDKDNKKQVFNLKPINLNNITPGEAFTKNHNYIQLIPPMKTIESLQIKITEVNSRKKDWDKWLELYNENQDKLKDYLLEIVGK